MKTTMSIIALSTLLTGCVSVTKFDEQKSTLEACREQAQKDIQSWQDKHSNLDSVLDKTIKERDTCRKEVEQTQAYAKEVEQRANDLREALQKEIMEKNVEIESLKGKLSVRVLDRILFKSGSTQILTTGKIVLNKLAVALQNNLDYIRVEGHTDIIPIGKQLKTKYFSNWELSTARSASVVRYFEYAHNVSPLRLEAVGFSKYRPVTEGQAPEDLQRNRRVEIILTQSRN